MAKEKHPVNVEIPKELGLTNEEIAALKDTFKFQIAGILSTKSSTSVGPFAETNIKIRSGPKGSAKRTAGSAGKGSK